jgi:hypothetical protein
MLGKVLGVLNVLAAFALVFFASSNWGQRQAWSYSAYRFQLAREGLPLDADTTDPEGGRQVDRLSDATFRELLRPVGGYSGANVTPADKTQLAEVQRVHDKLRSEVETANGEPAKRQKLEALLLPFASTLGERDKLAARIREEPVDKLLAPDGPFEQAFTQATQSAGPKGQERSPEDRRLAVARLLFNVSQDDAARQRAAVVVGLPAFTAAANQQAAALADMATQVRLVLAEGRYQFVQQHGEVVSELQSFAQDLRDRQADLDQQQAFIARHTALLGARSADVKNLQEQIEQARQASAGALQQLAGEQQRLFEADRAVGRDVQRNLQLEREIRQRESSNPR